MRRKVDFDQGTLFDAFAISVCGRDLPRAKPDPGIFLLAARELGVVPARSVVVEDAPAGIVAALAGGMAVIGVARLRDAEGLRAAGAQCVVSSLDEVRIPDREPFSERRTIA
jgi:beta-phosphoglucomutase-like phosphatase (HAD superfamily)